VAPTAINLLTVSDDLAFLILIAEGSEFLNTMSTTTSSASLIAGDEGIIYLLSSFRPSTSIILSPEAFVTSHLS
jgi:hypothetical protein